MCIPDIGNDTPLEGTKHHLGIIQCNRPYLLNKVSDFNEKLKAMQTQTAEKSHDEILDFDEVDYEVLHSLMLITCGASVILAAISIMNEIGWPT